MTAPLKPDTPTLREAARHILAVEERLINSTDELRAVIPMSLIADLRAALRADRGEATYKITDPAPEGPFAEPLGEAPRLVKVPRTLAEMAEDNVLERIAAHFGVDTSGMDFGHVEPGLWVEEFLKRRALREDPAPHDWNAALELAAHIVRSSGSSRALAGEGRVTHYHAQRISEEILSRRAARVSAPPRNLLDEYEEAAQDERGEVRE